jgi:hypothetical protein
MQHVAVMSFAAAIVCAGAIVLLHLLILAL